MPAAHADGLPVCFGADADGCFLLRSTSDSKHSTDVKSPAMQLACADAAAVEVVCGGGGPVVFGANAGGCALCAGHTFDTESAIVMCAPAIKLACAHAAGVLVASADGGPVVFGADAGRCFGGYKVGFNGAESSVHITTPAKKLAQVKAGSTGVGAVCLFCAAAFPRTPPVFSPQQRNCVSFGSSGLLRIAQVWFLAAVMAAKSSYKLMTLGVETLAVVPSPTWPLVLRPQQKVWPMVLTAQECAAPVATDFQKGPSSTSRGDFSEVVPAIPSWPLML